MKSWVFKSFLKVERDAHALVVLGSSFHLGYEISNIR